MLVVKSSVLDTVVTLYSVLTRGQALPRTEYRVLIVAFPLLAEEAALLVLVVDDWRPEDLG